MSLRHFLFVFLILVSSGRPVPAQFREKTVPKSCERRFIVGLSNYEPFAYREQGQLKGLAHDIIVGLQEKTGCQFLDSEMPRPKANDQLKKGRVDLLAILVRNSEYETSGLFLPIYKTHRELTVANKVYVKKKRIEDYVADDKIKFAYTIGYRSVLSEEEEKILLKSSRLVGVPTPEEAFRLLKEGRVQAVLFSSLVKSYYLKKLDMAKLVETVVDNGPLLPVGIYLSKRRVNTAEVVMFEEAIAEMKKDGSILRVLSKYMSPEEAQLRIKN